MKRTLTKFGNSCGLVIERPILELLGWRVGMSVDVDVIPTPDGHGLTIKPAAEDASAHEDRVAQASRNVVERHRAAFKKLAE